ncbi:diguanylate cyclase domain-containing protein [Roseateles cavernae]|uniref:diguanylate cyclase domain-containing protein n=1 Tax=Roseateles cavernae TaxID=3153578 RepID=UPI0032E51339
MADQEPSAKGRPARPPERSLVRRLTALNLTVLAATLLLTLGLIAGVSWLGARERQAQAAEQAAQLLAHGLAAMLVFEDRAAAAAELAAFAHRAELLELQLLDARGRLFARWPVEGATPAVVPAWIGRVIEGGEIHVHARVLQQGEPVGHLLLRESLAGLEQGLLRLAALTGVLALLAIVLAAQVLRAVQRRALAPIVELAALAEQVAGDHDYGRRAPVRRPDEVGRLSERFNEMLSRIEAAQQGLNQRLRQEQAAGQQLQQLAHHDSLTGLPNRLAFERALADLMAQSLQHDELMALVFIDLDNFKLVNDGHGHEAGDAVLREVARRMGAVLRGHDRLCRLGGDEFALLLPELPDAAAAEALAQRLIAAVREPLWVAGALMPVGATLGLAFCPGDADTPATLLARADAAMYAAKRAGKNCYRRATDV